jgi:ATP-binding cassette subfamily B protein
MTQARSSAPPGAASGSRGLVWRFWRDFLRQHSGAIIGVALLMILAVLLQLPAPVLTMYIVDHALASATTDHITRLALLFAGMVILRSAFSYVSETATLKLKERIILDLEMRLIGHLHRLPMGFFANWHSTYLQNRAMSDSRAIEGVLVRTLVTILVNGMTFLVGVGFVVYVRWELALMLLLFLVPFGLIRYKANQRMRQLSREMQERQSTASAAVAESFAGVRTVKLYGREESQGRALYGHLDGLRDIYVRTNWFGIVSTVGTGAVTALCTPLVLWYGARSVLAGSMTVGQVVAVMSFLSYLYTPINNFVAANLSIQQSTSAIQRIYEFLNHAPEPVEGRTLPDLEGAIAFENVDFSYAGGKQALQGVSFRIEPGRTVAIVGPSGAGKSTIVNLLMRFYETEQGTVSLDGVDVRELSVSFLRESIGVVDQQPFLFSGTILDNVRIGRPDATLEEVIEACQKSFAHDFIQSLPDGYETRVGERGHRLSGGECQRISLARIFLKDPKVLVLDEAVSAVDSASESYIQKALVPLSENRTMIIIAHRLSSLLLADDVILIDQGQIIERGSHASLMNAGGVYTRIFQEQFQPQLEKRSAPEQFSVV